MHKKNYSKQDSDKVLFICTDFDGIPKNGYTKDLINFIKIFHQKFTVKIIIITNNSTTLTHTRQYLDSINLNSISIDIIHPFFKGKAVRYFLPQPFLYFFKKNNSFTKKITEFSPDVIFVSPFHYLCINHLNYTARKFVYMGDSPSYQMQRAIYSEKNLLKKIKHFFSAQLYLHLENYWTKIGFTLIVVDEKMKKIVENRLKINAKISVCLPAIERSIPIKLKNKEKRILFLRPNSKGTTLLTNFLLYYPMIEGYNYEIIGGALDSNIIKTLGLQGIKYLAFIDDLDSHIASSEVAVITDLDGIGFCNRAAQVIINKTPLISTKNGVRGLSLKSGKHYIEFETEEGLFRSLKLITSNKLIRSNIIRESSIASQLYTFESLQLRVNNIINSI